MDFTTTALLASIRRRAAIPNSVALGSLDSDLLALATEELQGPVAAFLVSVREEYFVTYRDETLVDGTVAYDIPARAIGGALREVQVVDSGGATRNLVLLTVEEMEGQTASGIPFGFLVRGNKVVVHPAPTSGVGTLRLWYSRRPSELVPVSSAMAITSIAGAPTYAGAKPGSITTATPCDVVKAQPHFDALSDDITPQSVVASTSVTFSSSVAGAAVGDFVCLSGQSPVPQIPADLHPILAQRTAIKWLENVGYGEKADMAKKKLGELEERALQAIQPRVEGEAHYLVQRWWP